MRRRDLLGPWGEALACEYLRGRGCRIVACNYRSRFGEIDVIAEDRKFLIFAEVKLRKSAEYGAARNIEGPLGGRHSPAADGAALARGPRDALTAAL